MWDPPDERRRHRRRAGRQGRNGLCQRTCPKGARQGRYWTAGDVHGGKGRSLFVRLAPPGTCQANGPMEPTGQHGDLLDLIRLSTGAASLREALAEAHRFLAQPVPPTVSNDDPYDRTRAARNLWQRCRPIENTHAEAYLHARAIRTCRFPALRFHASLAYRDDTGRWRRLPALVAAVTDNDGDTSKACSAPGSTRTARSMARTSIASAQGARPHPRTRAVRFGEFRIPAIRLLVVGEGIETVLSLVSALPDAVLPGAALPETVAAAALSAGSLGAFVPPPGLLALAHRPGPRSRGRTRRTAAATALHAARHRLRGHRARRRRFQRRPESTRIRTTRAAPGDARDPAPGIGSDGCAEDKRMKTLRLKVFFFLCDV